MKFREFYKILAENGGKKDDVQVVDQRIVNTSFYFSKNLPFLNRLLRAVKIIRVDNEPDAQPYEVSGTVRIPSVKTMAVDAYGNVYINVKFSSKTLNDNTFIGVMAHEISHIFLKHLIRKGRRDNLFWNIAADAVINSSLLADGFALPKEGIIPVNNKLVLDGIEPIDLENKTVDDVYELLIKEDERQKDKDKDKDKEESEDGDEGEGGGDDEGEEGESGGGSKGDEGDEGDEGEGGGKPSKKSKPVRIGKATLDDHEYDDSKMREAEEQGAAPNKDILGDKEISEIINRIIDTNPGKGRGHNLKNIIKQHKVEIDWKTALRSFITANFTRVSTEYTYRKLKRVSYGIGVPIPSGVRTYQPDIDIVVAIDVSGSVVASPELLGKFKAEVVSLARTFKKPIEILYWDEVVQSKETIDKDGKIIKYKSSPVIKGGSGTSLSCVQEYMLKNKLRPKGVVYLTDGWIERNPVVLKGSKNLFVISTPGDISIVEPLGKVVRITSADHMYNPGRPYGGG